MTPTKRDETGNGPTKQQVLRAAHEEMQRFNRERRQSLRRAKGMDRPTMLMIVAIILLLGGLVVDLTYDGHTHRDPEVTKAPSLNVY